tara:strand:+ start:537 stop:896 length:360 start_codon:yes stop_codon:yes gene_type:complete
MLTEHERLKITSCLVTLGEHLTQIGIEHGFWEEGLNRNKFEQILLMHCELSEAVEAIRNGNAMDDHLPQYPGEIVELADTVIRIFDYVNYRYGMNNFVKILLAKSDYNEGRPYKHGKDL